MGDALDDVMLRAFTDELATMEKESGVAEWIPRLGRAALKRVSPATLAGKAVRTTSIPGATFAENMGSMARRFSSPVKGVREGWAHTSPAYRAEQAAAKALKPQELRKAQESGQSALGFVKAQREAHKGVIGPLEGRFAAEPGKGMFGRFGEHMLAPNTGLREAWKAGGGKGVAEQLSRGGYTGGGKYTKYIPIGERTQIAGFTGGFGVPAVVNAARATPTGEGGAMEEGLGAVGGGLGWIAGAGLGLPGMAGWYLADKAGRRLGRVADRFRAGGTASQALTAPSPTEAAEQLESIQRHYG